MASLECVAMVPHDRASRVSSLGLVDGSAQIVAGATHGRPGPAGARTPAPVRSNMAATGAAGAGDDGRLDGALGITARLPDGNRAPPSPACC